MQVSDNNFKIMSISYFRIKPSYHQVYQNIIFCVTAF
jgi:hypothetical protein